MKQRHVFIFINRNSEWVWLVEPWKYAGNSQKQNQANLFSMSKTFLQALECIKPRKDAPKFRRFADEVFRFACECANEKQP